MAAVNEVEALLEEAARDVEKKHEQQALDAARDDSRRDDRRDRDRYGDRRDRSRDRRGGHDRRRSRDRDIRRRDGSRPRSSKGDMTGRARSRSPRGGDKPPARDRDRSGDRRRGGDERRGPRRDKTATPEVTEDDRDKRTIFVQQISQRAETRHLRAFFETIGPVVEAQIVKDRVTGRSKG